MNTHKELLSECCSAKPCGEIAYDNSGRCGDCKEGCMFTEECDTSCGINADPADGFGKCTCGAELAEPTPPSQIEEEFLDEVFNEDCLETMARMADCSVDLLLTDPPYLIVAGGRTSSGAKQKTSNFLNRQTNAHAGSGKMFEHNTIKFHEWLPEAYRVLKNGSHAYVMSSGRRLNELTNSAIKAGFTFQNLLVWDKGNVTPNRYYMQRTEFILLLRKGSAKDINHRGTHNIFNVPNIIGNKVHPTEKPVNLMSTLVKNSTQVGEIVYDPFMGSGTTAVACKNLGRRYIGSELSKEYCDIAKQRLSQEVLL